MKGIRPSKQGEPAPESEKLNKEKKINHKRKGVGQAEYCT